MSERKLKLKVKDEERRFMKLIESAKKKRKSRQNNKKEMEIVKWIRRCAHCWKLLCNKDKKSVK